MIDGAKYNDVIEFYKTHNVKSTLKQFHITYKELKVICSMFHFVKSSEQIKDTYRTTRIDKYGSLEEYRESKKSAFNETVEKKYYNKEMYNFIKYNNIKKTNRKRYGVDNVMQDQSIMEKSVNNKKEIKMKKLGKEVD